MTYPALSLEDFINYAAECGIIQENLLDEAAVMKCFNETIVSTNTLKESGEQVLYRYEFIEILVRIAAHISRNRQGNGPADKVSISQTL